MNERQPGDGTSGHPAKTAVLVIAHGSRQEAANRDLAELVARLSARGDYPIVEGCFLELAEPDLPAGGDRCVAGERTGCSWFPTFSRPACTSGAT